MKLAPDLVPAAALAGRRLAEAGELRKAGKILTAAWIANPHPDLAEAYANLRFGDSARERLARVKRLVEKVPGHIEGALALARAALEARDFAAARAALAAYLSAPTRRVATLMAEIEEAEHGDEGRVREWMGRAMRAVGRSGVDRRRRRLGSLAAGHAQRPSRRFRMETAARRNRRSRRR